MKENSLVNQFVNQIIENSDYESMDRRYLINQVLALVGEDQDQHAYQPNGSDDMLKLKDELVEHGVQNHKIESNFGVRDMLGAQLMNFITPAPSTVNRRFWRRYDHDGPKAATDYFYQLSKANDYIKTKSIQRNIYFTSATDYGDLEITINLSKPEKDPKQIALEKSAPNSGYPLCQLCMENEGYLGRVNYPARSNHRIIRLQLSNHEDWGFQYSPYAYFNEHCIFLSAKHEPMTINRNTFYRLLSIIDKFPHYFVGSNADLPIVGGSILAHEHYQGGSHDFPMAKAPIEFSFAFDHFDEVRGGIVKWPMSVIRLTSANKDQLIRLATKILDRWRHYSDASVNLLAESNGKPHHTITPIARKRDALYELDLVLRDNQTSTEFPEGIFHPHKDLHHIKKENIGLIEVMGLAILPPRLKAELKEVARYLLGEKNEMKTYHKPWADHIKGRHPMLNTETIDALIHREVGKVFERVLEDAGVYKRSKEGQTAFKRFVESI
ncbi:UDP-glucose--hexose-1-phosphate uridylyltransferase [Sporolactobacillus shoreicorticis]|uniref:Galactose-1-phosphate uridylyltransferase n=1 Tax=Sporolactobacillus shoreicorticis TaxID=1923877 RepID=A0ABW5S0Z3_9BACL|nr:UDP-glucose--hexose-1-phosphate uridylyltransferase [Sporolactobacillus shoreicorticis]MCO7124649.1 UDP-glucose--hexose-1-phosphate uridylyltransferase [Sporolactobacillus shoreicorticis]